MPGYSFYALARVTPPDGAAFVIDIEQAMQYLGGPQQRGLQYNPELTQREDVNGHLRPRKRGFRPEVTFTFIDGGDMLDSDTVAALLNALMDPATTFELSLDAGTVWREAVLTKLARQPIRGKTYAGLQWDVTLQCADLIPELPGIGAGNW